MAVNIKLTKRWRFVRACCRSLLASVMESQGFSMHLYAECEINTSFASRICPTDALFSKPR